MPEEEDSGVRPILPQAGQLGEWLLRRPCVLLRVVERPVGDHGPAWCPRSHWERGEERTRVIRENTSCPAKTLPRERGGVLVREALDRDQIVVPSVADGIEPGYDLGALIRVGP
jgi:hypothetical protein